MGDPKETIAKGIESAEKAAVKVVETLHHHQQKMEWREVSLAEARNEKLGNGFKYRFELDVGQPGVALRYAKTYDGHLLWALRPDGTSLLVSPKRQVDRMTHEAATWDDLVEGSEPVRGSGWYKCRRGGLALAQWDAGRTHVLGWASDWAGVEVYDGALESLAEAAD